MSKVYFFLKDIDTSQVAGDNKREAWMPKSGAGYFDPVLQEHFETKRQKRAWMARHGFRECGMTHDPRKAPPEGRMRKPVQKPAGYQRTGPLSFVLH